MTNDCAGIEGADLIQTGAVAGHGVSARMLETFRAQGLVSRPKRAANRGLTPVWLYPPGTERQLVSLMLWREQTKNPDTLRVLLWMDGFPIPADAVRDSVSAYLSTMTRTLERELVAEASREGLHPVTEREATLNSVASTLAAKRGPNALPRLVRVAAAERSGAIESLLRSFALGETLGTTEEEAATAEMVLGISPGRRQRVNGAGPWLVGPAKDLFDAAKLVSVPAMAQALADATDAELESSRRLVVVLFRSLPLAARLIGAAFDDDNYAGMEGIGRLDQHPDFVLLLVPMVVGMIRVGWQENLDAMATALEGFPALAGELRNVLDMPAKEVEDNLNGQPAAIERQARLMIDAAMDGKLNEAPH
ncbi:hypothetical protein [Streptomyces sp. RKAG293]|uniref:hypothetical protein n=1 Tax=Streptomyces sp. RKAG293 TaxID=2893403 RepID=UPI0020343689|nr:hypothetical protein [Streptomyces sp. RKAG293]MCM2416510.1 hypothetical protein [Streptomyces sp. RKAG293]